MNNKVLDANGTGISGIWSGGYSFICPHILSVYSFAVVMFCLLPATIVCFFALIVWPLCLTWCTETFCADFLSRVTLHLVYYKQKHIDCNTHFSDFAHKFHIIWQKIFAFTSLWEIYISCTWFAKSTLQKFAQVEYSLNMGLFETAISQYWQRLTLWFLHLQWLQSPNGAESEIFRKKLSAFHFKVVFKWKTFQTFFCKGMPLEYGDWLWSPTFSYILSSSQTSNMKKILLLMFTKTYYDPALLNVFMQKCSGVRQ